MRPSSATATPKQNAYRIYWFKHANRSNDAISMTFPSYGSSVHGAPAATSFPIWWRSAVGYMGTTTQSLLSIHTYEKLASCIFFLFFFPPLSIGCCRCIAYCHVLRFLIHFCHWTKIDLANIYISNLTTIMAENYFPLFCDLISDVALLLLSRAFCFLHFFLSSRRFGGAHEIGISNGPTMTETRVKDISEILQFYVYKCVCVCEKMYLALFKPISQEKQNLVVLFFY